VSEHIDKVDYLHSFVSLCVLEAPYKGCNKSTSDATGSPSKHHN